MNKRLAILVVLLVLLIPMAGVALISTESGSAWLLRQVFSALPSASVATINGRLLDHISLTGLHYQSDTETLDIRTLNLTWQAAALLQGRITIVDLAIDGVSLSLSDSKQPEPASPFDGNAPLFLPVQLTVGRLLLTDMAVQQGASRHHLEKLQLKLATTGDQLVLDALELNAEILAATAHGQVRLGNGYALTLTADWQLDAGANGRWQGTSQITGDLNTLSFSNQTTAPFKVALSGQVAEVLTVPRIDAQIHWQQLVWPFTGTTPQVQSAQGTLAISGGLDDYQLTLNSALSQPYLPAASLMMQGKGTQTSLTIGRLALKSNTGEFQLNGKLAWQDAPTFALTATGQHFNPAILMPELPGDLTFSSQLQGRIADTGMQLAVTLNKLSGMLRNNPVSADGKLDINGGQITVNKLQIRSGSNHIAANGTMGLAQSSLNLTIDTPRLDAFWPTLGGSLTGQGVLQGTWQQPSITLKAQGRELRFAEHRAKQLSLDLNYSSTPNKTSQLLVSANSVSTGTMQIQSARLEGLGTPQQHDFKLAIDSTLGEVNAAVSGNLNNAHWQGSLKQLNVATPELGAWSVAKAVAIGINSTATGVAASLGELCLEQKSAALCVHAVKQAQGDMDGGVSISHLPLRLANAYLPKGTQLAGEVDAHADVRQIKGVLAGRYQVDISAPTLSLQNKELALGASSVTGTLKGGQLVADVDVGLQARDFVRGQIQFDTGKSQRIGGQLSASVQDFSVVTAFAPQLSGLKGQLNSQIAFAGTLTQPQLDGYVDLTRAALDLPAQNLGLHDLNLHAQIARGQNTLSLHGTLAPLMLHPTDTISALQPNGLVQVNAELNPKNGLSGQYDVSFPPISISLAANAGNAPIALGASTLTGTLKNGLVSADLAMHLVGKDYLRAQLAVDTGKAQTLSGQINAAVQDFTVVNPLVPQVSDLKGQLYADVALSGTLSAPAALGAIRFTGGGFAANELGISLKDIKLQALAADDGSHLLQVKGSARSGEGQVNLDGFISLLADADTPISVNLTGNNVEIARLPEAEIAISPDLKFLLADKKGLLTGAITVDKAVLKLKELPENAVKVSPDEIIIGEEKPQAEAADSIGVNANIDIALGKQVSFVGQGLSTHLEGRLKVIQADGKLSMHGNVDMQKARYKSYGQDLTVRKGRFQFNGPVDNPWLDVEAIRLSKSKKVTAILSLSGPLQKPQTRISSDPVLPEADALAYLVTGNPVSQVSKAEGNMLAAAALSYGGGQASWITDKLGIDEFEVQEGETLQDTLVAVGEYLTPNFYVGAKVGLFNKQAAVVLKHKLTESINIETQAGTSQRVKINYEIDTD